MVKVPYLLSLARLLPTLAHLQQIQFPASWVHLRGQGRGQPVEQRSSNCLGLIPVGLVSCPAGIKQQTCDLFSSVKWGTSNDASFETLHRVFESSNTPIELFFLFQEQKMGSTIIEFK